MIGLPGITVASLVPDEGCRCPTIPCKPLPPALIAFRQIDPVPQRLTAEPTLQIVEQQFRLSLPKAVPVTPLVVAA